MASLVRDTAWSARAGGWIDHAAHADGLNSDGTTGDLDENAASEPDRISIYRTPGGAFWDGKSEMVSAPLVNIREECLWWQVDADELWTAEQIVSIHRLLRSDPDRTAAYYWCTTSQRREQLSRRAITTRRTPRSSGCVRGGTDRAPVEGARAPIVRVGSCRRCIADLGSVRLSGKVATSQLSAKRVVPSNASGGSTSS